MRMGRNVRILFCIVGIVILILTVRLTKTEEVKTPATQKHSQEFRMKTEQPIKSEIEKAPATPKTTEAVVSSEKVDYYRKEPIVEKGTLSTKDKEKIGKADIGVEYSYTFIKDKKTLLKKENPLNVSMGWALKEIIPEDIRKSKAAELRIEVESATRTPIIETEAKRVPIAFDQLKSIKEFAEAENDERFLKQIDFILEQEEGDLITYGKKNVGKDVFSEIIVYSKKKYVRDLYLPAWFKTNMDRYLGAALLVTVAKDQIKKGNKNTAKLFFQKAADFSNNNALVMSKAAKTLLELK